MSEQDNLEAIAREVTSKIADIALNGTAAAIPDLAYYKAILTALRRATDGLQQEIARAKEILWDDLDRDKEELSLVQLSSIVSNGLYWRGKKITELQSQLAAKEKELAARTADYNRICDLDFQFERQDYLNLKDELAAVNKAAERMANEADSEVKELKRLLAAKERECSELRELSLVAQEKARLLLEEADCDIAARTKLQAATDRELEAKERECEELRQTAKEAYQRLIEQSKACGDKIQSLTAQLQKAQADVERLDWLEQQKWAVRLWRSHPTEVTVNESLYTGSSLRQAIDRARLPQAGAKPK